MGTPPDQQPPIGGFDSMTIDDWERAKAENWSRPVPDAEALTPIRATATTDRGPIAISATMPIATPGGDKVGEVNWSPTARLMPMADVYVPERIDAVFWGGPQLPRVELTLELRAGVPGYTRVELISEPGSPQIMAKHMQLACGRLTIWRDMILEAAAQDADDAPPGAPSWADTATVRQSLSSARRSSRWRLTPEHLQAVADLYRANLAGEPVKAIEAHYGVPERTAARWVQMCRSDEFQLLPKTVRGQRKA